MLFAFIAAALVLVQAPQAAQPAQRQEAPQTPAGAEQQGQAGEVTLHVTAREALIDLIALDEHNHPIVDLKPEDLAVSEWWVGPDLEPTDKRRDTKLAADATPAPVASLHAINPAAEQKSENAADAGFQISVSCMERTTQHYQLAIRPGEDGWKSGYHRIVIRSSRDKVRLFYRHSYYVGLTAPPSGKRMPQASQVAQVLWQAACAYPETPLSISIASRLLNANTAEAPVYAVTVNGNSLAYLTFGGDEATAGTVQSDTGNRRRVQLDYAACTFDSAGRPLNFFHAPVDQVLSEKGYSRALVDGFPHKLQFPRAGDVAVTRFVVRDRVTGNIGAVNVPSATPVELTPVEPEGVATATWSNLQTITGAGGLPGFGAADSRIRLPYVHPPEGPIGAFGSIVAKPGFLCGDVYELHRTSDTLPDFRELDPIGSLYAASLDVPNQDFSVTQGIPGVTPRTDLFGIDYHGRFWVGMPGEYQFLMMADDGALVEIDGKRVLNLDGLHTAQAERGLVHLETGEHTIHVPYYQGAPVSVALELWVKRPGGKQWVIFDVRDYAEPGDEN